MTEQDKAGKTTNADETDAPESDASANGDQGETEAETEVADSEDEEDLWAAAMAEQEAQESPAASPDADQEDDEEEDLWAAAMAEQAQAPVADQEPAEKPAGAQQSSAGGARDESTGARPGATAAPNKQVEAEAAGERVFRPLEQSSERGESRDLAMILDIPVRLSVELGRTKVTIKQLLEMAQGSVVELDGLAGEPMDILINGYLIAQGEVVVVEDKYGIRITEIVTPSERVQKLNR